PSGRLYKALVETEKAATVYASMPFTKEPSYIYFEANVPSDKSLEEAENIMLSVLDGLKDNPITEEELNRAKANLLKQYDQISRNSAYMATYVSEFIGAGDWRLMFIHRDRVEEMTVDKLNAAVQRYFITTNRTVGNFVPTKSPIRVEIEHTEGLDALVSNYKGKEGFGAGEVFDVSYENIQNRLESGELSKMPIEYGFIKKDNRGKTVTLRFMVRTGNVDDFMNKGRVASYTLRMLNRGTQNYSRQDIEDKLSAIKSSVYFNGGNGKVAATINTTEEHLMEALALMTEMLKRPKFDAAELEKLKTLDLASIEANKTDPQYLASKRLSLLNQKYPKGHPLYATTIEEDIEAIKDVSIEKIQAYYDTFFGISNSATLVAIGNIDEQVLKDYFETEFSDFKSNKPYTPIADAYKPNTAANERIKTPDKKNAFSIGVLTAEISQDDEDYPALEIASSILGGGFLNSRIASRLRQKEGISYGAGAQLSIDTDTDDKNSSLLVYAIYAPENAAKVQLGVKEEIARFIEEGITEDELKVAVTSWVQGENVSRARDGELTETINNNLYYDRDMMFHKEIEDKVTSLTVEDVNKVIKKYIKTFDNWTVINAGDFVEDAEIKNDAEKVD